MFTGEPTSKPPIDNNVRQSWNDYVDFLKKKGIAGSPELDKGGLGHAMLDLYIRENPGTYLKPEMVKDIQADFANLRKYHLEQIKNGKAVFAEGTNESNFMQELSKLDSYPGSLTTRHKFPFEYMTTIDKTNNTNTTENRGFVTTNK